MSIVGHLGRQIGILYIHELFEIFFFNRKDVTLQDYFVRSRFKEFM